MIHAAIVARAKAFVDRSFAYGIEINGGSAGPVMTGRRLSMIKKWAGAHDVSIDQAKPTLLTQAGIIAMASPRWE